MTGNTTVKQKRIDGEIVVSSDSKSTEHKTEIGTGPPQNL